MVMALCIGVNMTSVQAVGLHPNASDGAVVCYAPRMITASGLWDGDNPLDYSLPLFIVQTMLIVVTTRSLVFILKPLQQPRVVSEILGGVLLGPSGIGYSTMFANAVFPMRSVMVLETVAHIGLLYFLFLVGVEMDLNVIKRTGREAMVVALAGMALPFLTGILTGFILKNAAAITEYSFLLFLGIAVSVTAFPVLARILADLKLLNTNVGRISMSAAIINDLCAWVLLALAIALSETKASPSSAIYMVLSAGAFVCFCIFVLRPGIQWMISNTPEGENFNDFHICLILTGVMICAFFTDAIGTHSVFGAFVFGLIIPNGPLGTALIEKLEDFVTTMLLPLFFAINGLRTDLRAIKNAKTCVILLIIIFLACVGKIGGTLLVALYYEMPFHEGLALGMLMNTKGLVEVIILNVGREQKDVLIDVYPQNTDVRMHKYVCVRTHRYIPTFSMDRVQVLDEQAFAIMVITAVVLTGITVPVLKTIYRPARPYTGKKHRTIQRSKKDKELMILVCVHTPRNVPTIINLLEASHPTKKSPICVYTLHLVELTGRASAMLIVHNAHRSGHPAINRTQAQSEHIINAFQNYAQHTGNVIVQPLTAVSPYSTMHEDICNLADNKTISLIVVPFHKQQTIDGGMEVTNPSLRTVNQNVLANAPCSVGILIDRGFGGSSRVASSHITHHIAMLYFGGPDDREALSYAWRMAGHSGVNLTVIRFVPGEDVVEPLVNSNEPNHLTVNTNNNREKQLDDEFINEFRLKNVSKEAVVYKEIVVNHAEETVSAIRTMDSIHNLYIVGRGQGTVSPLTKGLTDWSECPELGAIGDLLASSDFLATVSVLVVQQYPGEGMHGDGVGTPESSEVDSNW
ncbi:hypothetical protein IFM89_005212 [Coptis chinensis]|uniref:Cation/H(+) antiporter 15 n=1 Tax=Coptis chinensis TaxID=261450 RepID=A0A835H1R5_9MAGN|nr:hypothetical protein IFM89_005212 [Coptis chinensis]